MAKSPYDIVLHPLFTEKSSEQKSQEKLSFAVLITANKIEIRQAIEKLWDVKIKSVRTQIVRGKVKRFGRNFGKRPNWKKAIITLETGEIDNFQFFETE
jgi:large subunit ribosomal protein L23